MPRINCAMLPTGGNDGADDAVEAGGAAPPRRRRERDGFQRGLVCAELGLSGREFGDLQHVGDDIGGLLTGELSRLVGGHRVDESC